VQVSSRPQITVPRRQNHKDPRPKDEEIDFQSRRGLFVLLNESPRAEKDMIGAVFKSNDSDKARFVV